MKDIAIRLALGAPGWRVTTAVLSDTMVCIGAGLAGGLVVALAVASTLRSYLFGVEPRDTITLVAACALVVTAALVASYLPARGAPRVDPIAALRAD